METVTFTINEVVTFTINKVVVTFTINKVVLEDHRNGEESVAVLFGTQNLSQ